MLQTPNPMSNSEPSVQHPTPDSGDPNPPEPDTLAAADADDHLPPDPLLKSGSFIDVDVKIEDQTLTTDPNDYPEPTNTSGNGPREPGNDKPAPPAAAETNAESTSTQRPKRVAAMECLAERPEWLPEDWGFEVRIRSSGVSAGSIDKYYVEPVSGRRFRSKKEVFHFIETGSKLKRKPNPDADAMSSESPGGHKQKKAGSKAKISAPPNFDFDNPPNEVSWALTNATTDTWTPFIGDEKVAESTKLEWDDAFEYLNTRKGDGTV